MNGQIDSLWGPVASSNRRRLSQGPRLVLRVPEVETAGPVEFGDEGREFGRVGVCLTSVSLMVKSC